MPLPLARLICVQDPAEEVIKQLDAAGGMKAVREGKMDKAKLEGVIAAMGIEDQITLTVVSTGLRSNEALC
jgi:hypothetical protein